MYLASVLPSAVSFVVKELVFRKQPGLSVFAVSFYGSMFELLFTISFLPLSAIPDFGHVLFARQVVLVALVLTVLLRVVCTRLMQSQVPLQDLPEYFVSGVKCWAGTSIAAGAVAGDPCFGDPWAPLVCTLGRVRMLPQPRLRYATMVAADHALNLTWNIMLIMLLARVRTLQC